MQSMPSSGPLPEAASSYSVQGLERLFREAQSRGLFQAGDQAPLGNPAGHLPPCGSPPRTNTPSASSSPSAAATTCGEH